MKPATEGFRKAVCLVRSWEQEDKAATGRVGREYLHLCSTVDETPVTKCLCNEGVSLKHSLAIAVTALLVGPFTLRLLMRLFWEESLCWDTLYLTL